MNTAIKKQPDLYGFLLTHHYNDLKIEGIIIHPLSNNSIVIKPGFSGYIDYGSGSNGRMKDLLIQEFGYSEAEAQKAFLEAKNTDYGTNFTPHENKNISSSPTLINTMSNNFKPPLKNSDERRVFAYLTKTRGISPDTIKMLVKNGLLYESADYHNAIFVNVERNYGEIRGTITDKPYKATVTGSIFDGSWYFSDINAKKEDIKAFYICEAAIDAISLYELHKKDGKHLSGMYCSIGGAAKYSSVERLKNIIQGKFEIYIAPDNDKAGDLLRERFNNFPTLRPKNKDWNEDLLKKLK